jgi:pyruvate dehydrogenase E1 component beta subunit
VPGLKVVMPATPHDAKGLLIGAIDDDAPVVFIEHRWLYNIHGPVPEGRYSIPLDGPTLHRRGRDVTIVASSYMTLEAAKAAQRLAADGIEAEIVDLRVLNPLDDRLILESVARTGRLVVCDHATLTGGFAGEIVARVVEKAFDRLKHSPVRVTLPDLPTPTTRALSNYFYPTVGHIVSAARATLGLTTEDPFANIGPADRLDVPDATFKGPF